MSDLSMSAAPAAIQDLMPSHCYGCGALNDHGLQIKSYWEGDGAVCTWQPESYHTAAPGVLYGGIIASLLDCHSAVTACAAAYQAEQRPIGTHPLIIYVTRTLNIEYLRPAPTEHPVVLTAHVVESEGRKARVACQLNAEGEVCAESEGLFIRVSEPLQR